MCISAVEKEQEWRGEGEVGVGIDDRGEGDRNGAEEEAVDKGGRAGPGALHTKAGAMPLVSVAWLVTVDSLSTSWEKSKEKKRTC